ncbi:hypothetical protein AALD22_26400 [Lachnospiraceae bacterium 56-18]|jgi:hypothetical protein|uniref:hypothetical protein n=1 Tax=Sporofaciens sp. JLR.KK001 TaxID=3112621 RepID=UPI002FF18F4B
MALTSEDLLAISQLLDTKLDARLKPMENDIRFIRDEQILMRDEQSRLRDEQALMRKEQALMREEQALMKEEQARINLIIENDILHAINILVENYLPAAKRYENATEKIESMQTDIDIMKKVIADHSEKLKKIS